VRKGEANTPVPLVSPELPPAVSYRRRLSPSPIPLTDQRDPLVSRARGREAVRGPRAGVGRAAWLGRAVA
jgi:hypothetical protein